MTLYSVRNWDELFENGATHQRIKALWWIPVPTKHDGKGYRRLIAMSRENMPASWFGLAMFGAFCLIEQEAGKTPKRGTLADQDGPLDAHDLTAATGAPYDAFVEVLKITSDPEYKINWLIAKEDGAYTPPVETPTPPIQPPPPQTEQTGQTEIEVPPAAPASSAANADAAILVKMFCAKARVPQKPWMRGEISDLVQFHGSEKVQAVIDTRIKPGWGTADLTDILNGRAPRSERVPAGSEAAQFDTPEKELAHYEAKRKEAALREKEKLDAEKRNAAKPEELAATLAKIQEQLASTGKE